MELKLPITQKKLTAILSGDIDEIYLSIEIAWTKRLFTNSQKMYVYGIGWTNYTIHRDAQDFRNTSDRGTHEDVHYMKRYLDNIREYHKLKPFTTVTFKDYKKNKYSFEFKGFEVGKTKEGFMDSRTGYVFVIKLGGQISND